MSAKTWIKDVSGMYIRVPGRGAFKGQQLYCARVWVTSHGKFRHFVLGTAKRAAEKRLNEIKVNPEAALTEKRNRAAIAVTFKDLAADFLSKYRSRGGTNFYHAILRAPAAHFGETPLSHIDASALDRYLSKRRSEKTKGKPRKIEGVRVMVGAGRRRVSESSLRHELIALGTCFRWARQRGIMASNPLADYQKPAAPGKGAIVILSPEQEQAARAVCPAWAWDVVEWALYTGVRQDEGRFQSWKNIDRGNGVIHVIGSKTNRIRNVPMNLSAKIGAILDRHPRSTMTDLLFHDEAGKPLDKDVLGGIVEAALKAAGVPKERGVLWNRFRHTCITRLAASGQFSSFEIADMMGTSPTMIEKHYRAYFPVSQERTAGVLDRVQTTIPRTVPPEEQFA
jgi:integrase